MIDAGLLSGLSAKAPFRKMVCRWFDFIRADVAEGPDPMMWIECPFDQF